MEKDLRIIFIVPKNCASENDVGPLMKKAHSKCKEKLDLKNISWVKESAIESILPLAKTDTVVIENFENEELIDSLKDVNGARLLGPTALLGCLYDDKPIPNFPWYIYNISMYDCVITSSGYTPDQKKYIRQKVQLMGGAYVDHLTKACTHLVTDTVKSVKYIQAGEAGVSIMTLKWIEKVWEASQVDDIHCNNASFGYLKCLPFHQLTITSTGIKSMSEKQTLERNVVENGGIFSNKLKLKETDILVVVGPGSGSEKFQVASKSSSIQCVTMDWITDSIKHGYSMPHNQYAIERETSTPVKEKHNPNFSNLSTLSAIAPIQTNRTTVEASVMSLNNESHSFPDAGCSGGKSVKRKANISNDEVSQLVDLLDIRKAKLAGQFLDSCGVYIAGFNADQREKICKILNVSGATRYDDISDRITHVIVGDVSCHDVKLLRSNCQCVFVTLMWLLASIDGKRPAEEENYFVNFPTEVDSDRNEDGSPISKQGIKLLRSHTSKIQNENRTESVNDDFYRDEVNSLKNYLENLEPDQADTLAALLKNDYETTKPSAYDQQKTLKMPSEESQYTMDSESQPVSLFAGLKFLLHGFDEEEYNDVKKIIEDQEGVIVQSNKFKGFIDYLVSPICVESECRITAGEVVSKLFLLESVGNNGICPIEYYHRPLLIKNASCLKNYVVTISSYTGYERIFLKAAVTAMDGISQEQFSKNVFPEKNIIPATHLVSADANGKKYEAAIKWGVPVVGKDWLLESAKIGSAADESPFLIGKSKAPERSPLVSIQLQNMASENSDLCEEVQIAGPSKSNFVPFASTPLSKEKNPLLDKVKDTPEYYSQITPVKEIMKNAGLSTPGTSPPRYPWRVKTPKTPYGAFVEANPSPSLRKQMLQYINQFPDYKPPPQRRQSTPLSEIKRNFWRKAFEKDSQSSSQLHFEDQRTDEVFEIEKEANKEIATDSSAKENKSDYINNKLMKLEEMAAGENSANKSRGSRAFQSTNPVKIDPEIKDSQACTVGWDYDYQARDEKKPKLFMVSGLESDIRDKISEDIIALGGQISELYSYDPNCTHLLCPKPTRNEKILSCMASGKWILHHSYIADSVKAGKFLYEDEYEFGNPKFQVKGVTDANKNVIHFWRKEIRRRGYGAFHDVRAIVVANKREPLVKVLEAGGGTVLDLRPPFDNVMNITHCLLEPRCIKDFTAYYTLAEKGIYCVNTLFINDFLNRKDVKDSILPNFQKFY